MSDSFGLVVAIAAGWVAIGLVLSVVIGSPGHDSAGWLVLGTLLGPLAVALAVDAERKKELLEPARLPGGPCAPAGPGPVDLLVGFNGSSESAAPCSRSRPARPADRPAYRRHGRPLRRRA